MLYRLVCVIEGSYRTRILYKNTINTGLEISLVGIFCVLNNTIQNMEIKYE